MIKKLFLLSTLTLAMAGCSTTDSATESTTETTEDTTEEVKVETITEAEVDEARERWAEAIISIGTASEEGMEEATEKAEEVIETLYAYDEGAVLLNQLKLQSYHSGQQKKKHFLISLAVISVKILVLR